MKLNSRMDRSANSNRPLALIWDVDGTLADTEQSGHRPAFNQAFAEFGLDWHWDARCYQDLLAVSGGRERISHYLATCNPSAPELPDAALAEWIARLHRRKTEIYQAILAEGRIPLQTGVERLLREARAANLRQAIATTTSPANVERLLAANLGAAAIEWFEVIGAGDQVSHKKPAPDIYCWVVDQMDVDPARCVAIEDSRIGLDAACAAGIGAVLVCAGTTDAVGFDGAGLVVDHLGAPGEPCTVLRGRAGSVSGMIDLAVLSGLLPP